MSTFGENFQRMREKVLGRKPVLREIIEKRGDKNLYDYAKEYIDVNLSPPIQRRQDEFFAALKDEIQRLLGQDVALSALEQLKNHYYVGTVDHHGPLTHPFFLNGNLLTTAPYFDYPDPCLKNVIVLACGNVSLNNSSFPRGLLFNTYNNGVFNLRKLPFLPSSARLCPVFNFRPYTAEEIRKVKILLEQMVAAGEVYEPEAIKLRQILDEIYLRPDIVECKSFSDQITKSNFELWKRFFESSHVEPPNLIYLEQERLVIRLLTDYHLFQDTTITHIFFDHAYDDLITTYFDGIQGAFSLKEKWGTYLFWALPEGAKYRLQLWKEGDYLVSEDKSYRVKLTPDELLKAFQRNELIPSMMLAYIVLSFYYGLKCLGGFSQVNYLTFMKNAYIKMQADRGNYRSIEVCARAQTKEMGGDFTVAFMGGPKGELIPATGLDLVLYGHEKTWQTIVDESKEIQLGESIDPLMPEFFRIVTTEAEREPDLMAITDTEITKFIGLDKKIRPCVSVRVEPS